MVHTATAGLKIRGSRRRYQARRVCCYSKHFLAPGIECLGPARATRSTQRLLTTSAAWSCLAAAHSLCACHRTARITAHRAQLATAVASRDEAGIAAAHASLGLAIHGKREDSTAHELHAVRSSYNECAPRPCSWIAFTLCIRLTSTGLQLLRITMARRTRSCVSQKLLPLEQITPPRPPTSMRA